jgi:competence protein ComEA
MDKDKIIKISIILIIFILCGCLYSCKDSEKTVVSLEEQTEGAKDEAENKPTSDVETDAKSSASNNIEAEKETESKKLICVYICGEVQTPGVYQVEEGARMYQVVELAGGILETGAQNYLNLAESVTDGQKVVVPTIEEASQLETVQVDSTKEESSSKYININTADEATLDSLPGIGASKAKNIIAYRESNGGFKSVEELMQIEGIKEGVYNKIKDMITVK